ncbi:molybdopterin biosynthesis protein MoeB [Saccharibacter sp. 17.LH.SD]|uniref:HesA/MoeB/ThiF family protein n=1 Tax=Saccharibacter sp. 17.LH.SD TaxID=2689393 RepID=UPI001371E8C0|nr:HesA/MoeB/ThiF family protein [Saccharibacter sp. 17.LH.SD]MXV43547.1 molybdopterin biosynthesis protein MoeB [Saccharibacter sp. 17.LH.SD]
MHFSDEELERYSRHILLPQIGALGQDQLRQARILVIGAGGLGTSLLQQLACSGIGHIGLIDPDRVSLSNLQRQVLYHTDDVGRLKVDVARERLQQLNSHCEVLIWPVPVHETLLGDILPHYDIVCDGTDNAATRMCVSDSCVALKKTLISGSVQGVSGQLAVFRPHHGGPCYRCLFPEALETPSLGCAQAGVLGPAVSVMAGFMAIKVVKECLHLVDDLSETRLMLWDALTMGQRFYPVARDAACPMHSSS